MGEKLLLEEESWVHGNDGEGDCLLRQKFSCEHA